MEKFDFIKLQKIEAGNKSSHYLLPIFFDNRVKKISRDKFINIMTKNLEFKFLYNIAHFQISFF